MIINIAAHSGEGKTKTALQFSCIDLKDNKKVIYLSEDENVNDWIPDIVDAVGGEKAKNFKPMYAKNLENALIILPYIDHLPYDSVVIDGFHKELAELAKKNKLEDFYTKVSKYTTHHQGRIIVTSQLNSSFNA